MEIEDHVYGGLYYCIIIMQVMKLERLPNDEIWRDRSGKNVGNIVYHRSKQVQSTSSVETDILVLLCSAYLPSTDKISNPKIH